MRKTQYDKGRDDAFRDAIDLNNLNEDYIRGTADATEEMEAEQYEIDEILGDE